VYSGAPWPSREKSVESSSSIRLLSRSEPGCLPMNEPSDPLAWPVALPPATSLRCWVMLSDWPALP
jgi:hypothetical protein